MREKSKTMKKAVRVLTVCGLVIVLGSSTVPSLPSVGASACYKIVRADYLDLAGNHPHSNTLCEVFNKSHTTPISITDIYVLGAGGVGDIKAWYTGLYGQVVPPLGRIRFNVNDTVMPTLVPQTSVGNHGVANVVVGWTGGCVDTVELTSNTVRVSNGNKDDRTEMHYVGFPVMP